MRTCSVLRRPSAARHVNGKRFTTVNYHLMTRFSNQNSGNSLGSPPRARAGALGIPTGICVYRMLSNHDEGPPKNSNTIASTLCHDSIQRLLFVQIAAMRCLCVAPAVGIRCCSERNRTETASGRLEWSSSRYIDVQR